MVSIEKIDHIGIRVREKQRSITFYEALGFALITDIGFEKGHPIMMEHASGIVLNLLGPSTIEKDENILMDVENKFSGYTHMALKVNSLSDTVAYFAEKGFEITGQFTFKNMKAIFIRDPDRNVIEFDAYLGDSPESRMVESDDTYSGHP